MPQLSPKFIFFLNPSIAERIFSRPDPPPEMKSQVALLVKQLKPAEKRAVLAKAKTLAAYSSAMIKALER